MIPARAFLARAVLSQQEIETLINEEVLLFAEYLRNEMKDWTLRIGATAKKVKERCTEHWRSDVEIFQN